MLTPSQRRLSICIDTPKLFSKWAAPQGAASLKISRGTIFGRDYSVHTKWPCEWRDDCLYRRSMTADCFISVSAATVLDPVKILLLQLKRIGDLILTTPAIAVLRERFPDAEVTMVVSSECADLLPAIGSVDRILMARRYLRDLAAFLAVAGKRFDYCIDFTRNDRSAALAFLSGARKRIVSYRVRDQAKNRARLYTDFVDVRMRDLHTIDYNLSLLEPLGIRDVSTSLHLQLPQSAHEKADLLRRNWNISKPFVILHPGSARQEKLWEAARWTQVIEQFDPDNDIKLILTSGAS